MLCTVVTDIPTALSGRSIGASESDLEYKSLESTGGNTFHNINITLLGYRSALSS